MGDTPATGQIVAIGGGGFSEEPTNLALDRYVLGLTPRERPKVCFLGTASGDADGYVRRFRAAFVALGAEPSALSLFRPHPAPRQPQGAQPGARAGSRAGPPPPPPDAAPAGRHRPAGSADRVAEG